jgi:hypothetical protein
MDIWRTRPHEPETWKVKANCPFCGDESFTTDVKGGFHIGGYGVVKDDDPSSDVPSTKVDHFETEGETFKFFIVKARADAKPVRAR